MSHSEMFSDCFDISHAKIGNVKLYVPSVGVMSFIKKYVKSCIETKKEFDKSFIKNITIFG